MIQDLLRAALAAQERPISLTPATLGPAATALGASVTLTDPVVQGETGGLRVAGLLTLDGQDYDAVLLAIGDTLHVELRPADGWRPSDIAPDLRPLLADGRVVGPLDALPLATPRLTLRVEAGELRAATLTATLTPDGPFAWLASFGSGWPMVAELLDEVVEVRVPLGAGIGLGPVGVREPVLVLRAPRLSGEPEAWIEARVAAGSLALRVRLDADLLDAMPGIAVHGAFDAAPLGALADLAALVGADDLAELVPAGLQEGLRLRDIAVHADPASLSVLRVQVTLATTGAWAPIDGGPTLRDATLHLSVNAPFSADRCLGATVTGTVQGDGWTGTGSVGIPGPTLDATFTADPPLRLGDLVRPWFPDAGPVGDAALREVALVLEPDLVALQTITTLGRAALSLGVRWTRTEGLVLQLRSATDTPLELTALVETVLDQLDIDGLMLPAGATVEVESATLALSRAGVTGGVDGVLRWPDGRVTPIQLGRSDLGAGWRLDLALDPPARLSELVRDHLPEGIELPDDLLAMKVGGTLTVDVDARSLRIDGTTADAFSVFPVAAVLPQSVHLELVAGRKGAPGRFRVDTTGLALLPRMPFPAKVSVGGGTVAIAADAPIRVPLGVDLGEGECAATLTGLRIDIRKATGGWTATGAATVKAQGAPGPLRDVLGAGVEAGLTLANGRHTFSVSKPGGLAHVSLPLGSIPTADGLLDLGEVDLLLDDVVLVVSARKTALAVVLDVGLPPALNHVLGTKGDGEPRVRWLRTWDAATATGERIHLDIGPSATGLTATLRESPFAVGRSSPGADQMLTLDLDLGDVGALQLTLPALNWRPGGGDLSVRANATITRRLGLPTGLLKTLLAQAGMDAVADGLPDTLPFDDLAVLRDDQLDADALAAHLGGGDATRALAGTLASAVTRLPRDLREYLSFQMPRTVELLATAGATGNVRAGFETDPATPLRVLFPALVDGLPGLVGLTLHRLEVGVRAGGTLLEVRVDGHLDLFDPVLLAVAALVPDDVGLLRPGPDIRRRVVLQNVFALGVWQTGIPLVLPLFYDRIGLVHQSVEMVDLDATVAFPEPDAPTLLALVRRLVPFFSQRDAWLDPATPGGEDGALTLRFRPTTLVLPPVIGRSSLALRDPDTDVPAWSSVAHLLNAVKHGSLAELVAAVPTPLRVVAAPLHVGPLRFEVDWILSTPAKWREDLHDGLGASAVDALAPLLPGDGTQDGLAFGARGSWAVGPAGVDGRFALAFSPSTGFRVAGAFDGGLSDVVALSGTASGEVRWSTSPPAAPAPATLTLDGREGVYTAAIPLITTALSVAMRVRTKSLAAFAGMLTLDGAIPGSGLRLHDSGALRVTVGRARRRIGRVSVADGAWHDVFVSWRAADGRLRMWVDGELAGSWVVGRGASLGLTRLVIGQRPQRDGWMARRAWAGEVASLRVWRQALTPTDTAPADWTAAFAPAATAVSTAAIPGASLDGAGALTLFGHRALAGRLHVGTDGLELDGTVDLFGADWPLTARGSGLARIGGSGSFLLEGAVDTAIAGIPLGRGALRLDPDGGLIEASWLGCGLRLGLDLPARALRGAVEIGVSFAVDLGPFEIAGVTVIPRLHVSAGVTTRLALAAGPTGVGVGVAGSFEWMGSSYRLPGFEVDIVFADVAAVATAIGDHIREHALELFGGLFADALAWARALLDGLFAFAGDVVAVLRDAYKLAAAAAAEVLHVLKWGAGEIVAGLKAAWDATGREVAALLVGLGHAAGEVAAALRDAYAAAIDEVGGWLRAAGVDPRAAALALQGAFQAAGGAVAASLVRVGYALEDAMMAVVVGIGATIEQVTDALYRLGGLTDELARVLHARFYKSVGYIVDGLLLLGAPFEEAARVACAVLGAAWDVALEAFLGAAQALEAVGAAMRRFYASLTAEGLAHRLRELRRSATEVLQVLKTHFVADAKAAAKVLKTVGYGADEAGRALASVMHTTESEIRSLLSDGWNWAEDQGSTVASWFGR